MNFIVPAVILMIVVSLIPYLIRKNTKQIVQEEVIIEPPVKKKRVYKKRVKKVKED
jgi:hypothetical protein